MCYRDRTFCCAGDECVCHESRKLTPEVEEAARRWWSSCGGEGEPPIALSDLCAEKREEAGDGR